MNEKSIIAAIKSNKNVYWKNNRYHVIFDNFNRLLVIDVYNQYCNMLCDSDLKDCFICEA